MKKLLFLAIAAGLGFASAHAYTAAEIAAKGKVWRSISEQDVYFRNGTYEWQYTSNIPYFLEGDINVSLNNSGNLILEYGIDETFFGGEVKSLPLEVKISGTTATVVNGTFQLYVQTGIYGNIPLVTDLKFTRITHVDDYFYGLIPLRQNLEPKFGDLTGTVTKDADGNFRIAFEPFEMVKIHQTRGYIYVFDVYGNPITSGTANYFALDEQKESAGAVFQTYTPNATITDTEYAYNNMKRKSNPTARSYTAGVTLTDNSIEIDNWSNIGWAAQSYLDNYDILNSYHKKITGSFNNNTLEASISPSEVIIGAMSMDNLGNLDVYARNMSGLEYDIYQELYSTIDGTLGHEGIAHKGTNKWLNKLDNRTMMSSPYIDFEDYFFVDVNPDFNYNMSSYVENTRITLNEDKDYTHDVNLNKREFGYGTISATNPDTYIFLNCDLSDFKNSYYVEDYELYIVPGKFSESDFGGSDFFHEDGHAKGTRIDLEKYHSNFTPSDETRPKKVPAQISDEQTAGNYTYNLLIPEKDVVKANDGKYSLYVKAIYSQESHLEPSFHGMTLLDEPTTGVESVIDNGSANQDAPAVYYNMNGVQVNGDALTPGLYIRQQGNTTTKVVVK